MGWILPDILSLTQYLSMLEKEKIVLTNMLCPYCGKLRPWNHGFYLRKPDRSCSATSLNPVPIQRFYCSHCKKTFSALPECIPPRRWYMWSVQQTTLMLFMAGRSVYAIAKEMAPSRHTLNRWIGRFRDQFQLHRDTVVSYFADLGRSSGLIDFWNICLAHMPLSKAMRLCHASGVLVP